MTSPDRAILALLDRKERMAMLDVYELYGSRDAALAEMSNLVSRGLGVTLEAHDSYYRNEYFLASGPAGQKITIESNELEDEDGNYFQEPKFTEYQTLVRLEYEAPAQEDGQPHPDEFSDELGILPGLILLERYVGPGRDSAASSEGTV